MRFGKRRLKELHSLGGRLPLFKPFDECTYTVAELLAPDHTHIGYPIELDHPPRPLEGVETVPGIGIVTENQKRAFIRRHFGDHVLQVIRAAQQTQAAGLGLPCIIHVDQHGHQLGARIRVDLAISRR